MVGVSGRGGGVARLNQKGGPRSHFQVLGKKTSPPVSPYHKVF